MPKKNKFVVKGFGKTQMFLRYIPSPGFIAKVSCKGMALGGLTQFNTPLTFFKSGGKDIYFTFVSRQRTIPKMFYWFFSV